MSAFLQALHSGRVLLMDGAMGTELIRAGLPLGEVCESWNLTHPERVQAVHQAYVDAGAEVLLTNTFQANPVALGRHGLEDQLELVHGAAVSIAKCARRPTGFVLVDVGPLPVEIGRNEPRIRKWFEDIVRSSRDADGFLLETYSGWMANSAVRFLLELRGAFSHSRHLPVLISFAYEPPLDQFYSTLDGQEPETMAHWAEKSGVAALGVNCGRDIDMDDIIEIVRRYRAETDLPLFARPNAGTPTKQGEQWIYPHTPEAMAARLPELLEAGVSMVGGCCGTTPAHIAAFRAVIDTWNCGRTEPRP